MEFPSSASGRTGSASEGPGEEATWVATSRLLFPFPLPIWGSDTDPDDDSDDVVGPASWHRPEAAEPADSDAFLSDELDRKSVTQISCFTACASRVVTLTRAGLAMTLLLACLVVSTDDVADEVNEKSGELPSWSRPRPAEDAARPPLTLVVRLIT